MGRAGGNKRTPRPVPSRVMPEPIWRRVLRGEPKREPLPLCEFAGLVDPDCKIGRYRMVLTVIVSSQEEGDEYAERLRAHGFDDGGWKQPTDTTPSATRMLVGVEATVMITLGHNA